MLKLCDRAGLVGPGVVSIDGTRIAGNASPEVNHTFEQIAREIIAEARATDEAEDEEFGEARGDELPEQLRTPEGRREFFRQAREQLRRKQQSPEPTASPRRGDLIRRRSSSTPRRSSDTGAGRDAWIKGGASSSSTAGQPGPEPSVARRAPLWPPSDCKQTTTSSVVQRRLSAGPRDARDRLGRRPGAMQSPTGDRSCRPAR